jgi:hypothetical protein
MSLIHVPLSVLPRTAPLHVTPECLPVYHSTIKCGVEHVSVVKKAFGRRFAVIRARRAAAP